MNVLRTSLGIIMWALCLHPMFADHTQNIACNNQVNISPNAICTISLTPDMLLEAGDDVAYSIVVDGQTATSTGLNDEFVGIDFTEFLGEGLVTYSITNEDGNTCWGDILFEDKLALALECGDFEVHCSQTLEPGDPLNLAEEANIFSFLSVSDDTTRYQINWATLGINNVISRVALNIELDINAVNTLEAILVSPAGTEVDVFDLTSSGCSDANFDVIFSDDGANSSGNFLSPVICGQGINAAFCGSYQPESAFSAYNNEVSDGLWTLMIINTDEAGNPHTLDLDESYLSIDYHNLTIPFPFDGTWTENGDGTYTLSLAGVYCGPYQAYYTDEDVVGSECDDAGPIPTLKTIVRTWYVTGPANTTSTCSQTIIIRRWDSDPTAISNNIIYPPSYDGQAGNEPSLSCKSLFSLDGSGNINPEYINLADTVPLPALTGYPRAQFGDLSLCGNVQFEYTDTKFRLDCDFSFKVFRRWVALDWCTGIAYEYDQIIKVIDDEAPLLVCNTDYGIEYTTGYYTCNSDIILPVPKVNGNSTIEPVISFECGDETWTYTVEYVFAGEMTECDEDCPEPSDILESDFENDLVYVTGVDETGQPIYGINNVPLGCAWIRYIVTDQCGNSNECRTEIRVVDDVKPAPVCLQFTVATFDELGCVNVFATSFDNGSWDNCGVEDYLAREANTSDVYQRELQFCCDDGYMCGDQIMIELMVFDDDLGGQDDIINNGGDLALNNECANYNNCMVVLEFQDKLPPYIEGDIDDTFPCDADPIDYNDLLGYASQLSVGDNLECTVLDPKPDVPTNWTFEHEAGCEGTSITVSWTIDDGCGNTNQLLQTLSFGDAEKLDEDDINWPPTGPHIIVDCGDEGFTPEELAELAGYTQVRPEAASIACSQTAVSYDDQYFYEVDDDEICKKLIRTWTLIDWCQFNFDPSTGYYYWVQVFKLKDDEGPEIKNEDVLFTCDDLEYTNDPCNPFIKIPLDGCDNCSEINELEWDVCVYECQDGTNGTPDRFYSIPLISGDFLAGVHTAVIKLTDACGNLTEKVITFEIPDCSSPNPYCISELVITLNAISESAEIWASDFDQGSYDDCDHCDGEELSFYFDEIKDSSFKVYTCADFGPEEEVIVDSLEMWVFDKRGNKGHCNVKLKVESHGICEPVELPRISGYVMTEDSDMVDAADVMLSLPQTGGQFMNQTSNSGEYSFDDLDPATNYEVVAAYDTDILNGVTTQDLVKIQQHILGINDLTSPYKIIAADVNNSNSVTAADLVKIRQAILGMITQFPNGQKSWRLIDFHQTFMNQGNPFPYQEILNLTSIPTDMDNLDFMAIKMGDVTNSATLNVQGDDGETRGNEAINLAVKDVSYNSGDVLYIPVSLQQDFDCIGMQFTLSFDAEVFEVLEIGSDILGMQEENVSYLHSGDGYITVSWNDVESLNLSANESLFWIKAAALDNGQLSETIQINSSLTVAELYDAKVEAHDINLDFLEGNSPAEEFRLLQNVPNPFDNTTEISFVLPSDDEVIFSVFDVNGKLVYQRFENYKKGVNSLTFDGTVLGAQGIFYYQIECKDKVETMKMIYIPNK